MLVAIATCRHLGCAADRQTRYRDPLASCRLSGLLALEIGTPVSIARRHVSPFSFCRCICCIGHRSVVLGCLVYGKSIPCCRSSPARLVFQNCSPGSQIQGAGAAIPAGYSQSRSFYDRSNSRPTYPTRAETSRHQCAQLANVCLLRAQVGATVRRLRQIAHIAKVPSAHPIATLGQPRIRSYVFDADMYAADVLRNDTFV